MAGKTVPVTGGSLCGAVRYESAEPPEHVSYCHYRMCQKSSGNPYFLAVFLPVKGFWFTDGPPKFYRSSAWAERGFCAECGTPLVMRLGTTTHAVYIGTLDHPEEWPPAFAHSGMESRIPWDAIHDDLPRWNTEDDPDYKASRALIGRDGRQARGSSAAKLG